MDVKEIISSGLLELYATGSASAEEAKLVLQWAAQYPEVADELVQIETAMNEYAMSNAVEPIASVKEKIFAKINENDSAKVVEMSKAEPIAKVVPVYSRWKNLAAAAILLLIGSTALNLFLYNKTADINKELLQAKTAVDDLENKAAEMESNWKLVQSKYSQPVALNGLDVAPGAAAKVFWMKNTGEVYLDPSNLPQAPSGKQYHLWAIVDSKPVDAGVVLMDKKGNRYNVQKMKTFGKVEAFAVSLEEAGNEVMEAPKGDIYVMGKM